MPRLVTTIGGLALLEVEVSVNHPDLDGAYALLSFRSQSLLEETMTIGSIMLEEIQYSSCLIEFLFRDERWNIIRLSLTRKNFNRPCPVCGSERAAHNRPVSPMVSL